MATKNPDDDDDVDVDVAAARLDSDVSRSGSYVSFSSHPNVSACPAVNAPVTDTLKHSSPSTAVMPPLTLLCAFSNNVFDELADRPGVRYT